MTDWSAGRYELTAERLVPAARVAVEALAPQRGEEILDVGCGTGNAALLAGRAGAWATGVDSAPRLIEVARERAAAEAVRARFVAGDAAALPFADRAFDAAVSVFGVVFAPLEAAARELVRVVRPGGRIVLTTWVNDGPNPRVFAAIREAVGGGPPPPLTWSDLAVVARAFAPHEVAFAEHALPFTAPSAAAYVAEQVEHHPLWAAGAPALREAGKLEWAVERATEIFAEANEDPAAFRTTSSYHVVSVRVDASPS